MRVRKKKNGQERFEAASDVITSIPKNEPRRANLGEILGDFKSYRLEIGCGKGAFAAQMAKLYPEIGFIGMEVVRDVIIFAAEKAKKFELSNLRFICSDAAAANEIFEPGTFEVIYINFCDPWPKARHAKRRLTCKTFLEKFKPLLTDGGRIEFKTDNRALFDFSVAEFELAGYEVYDLTHDLHSSAYAEGNVMTEYENNFSQKGVPINRLCARVR